MMTITISAATPIPIFIGMLIPSGGGGGGGGGDGRGDDRARRRQFRLHVSHALGRVEIVRLQFQRRFQIGHRLARIDSCAT